jgi:PTS system ascorbate-specific IIB component
MKKYHALVVCGTGMGSSMILKIMVDQVVSQNKLPVHLESDVVSAAHSSRADFFICGLDLQPVVAKLGRPVVGIKNILDRGEILAALQAELAALEGSQTPAEQQEEASIENPESSTNEVDEGRT